MVMFLYVRQFFFFVLQGGADIKAGGIMAGMSRDKCGAAAVAGFFKVGRTLC